MQLKGLGFAFVHQTLSSIQQIKQLRGANVVVNASVLGARELEGDKKVHEVHGQTMFVNCEGSGREELLNQVTLHQGSHYTYAIPRPSGGGIILGGVSQASNTYTEPDVTFTARHPRTGE
jgi:hypothetical protein